MWAKPGESARKSLLRHKETSLREAQKTMAVTLPPGTKPMKHQSTVKTIAFLSLVASASGLAQPPRPAMRGGGGGGIDQTTQVINDCERRTNSFERTLRRALNSSAINRTPREDQLNRDTDRLEQAMDKLGDSWNRDHNVQRTRQYVSAAIAAARDINKTMVIWHLDADAKREWGAVRGELNRLAQTLGLPRVGW
jgi:hypothetical protein